MKTISVFRRGFQLFVGIALVFAIAATHTDVAQARAKAVRAHVKVKKPNGAEVWIMGNKVVVKWRANELVGDKVRVELLRSNGFCTLIAARTANDGKLRWVVPGQLAPDNNYSVRVIALDESGARDTSDSYFSVVGLGL